MKFLKNKQNIFLITSILFLGFLVFFYGYRLVFYYRIEHPKATIDNKVLLIDKLKAMEDIGNTGNGLYKDKDTYYFKGKPNNYLRYAGRIWRIIKINSDQSISLITEDTQTLLNYDNALEWLNKSDIEHTGIFYNSLSNIDNLVNTSICIDIVENVKNITCKDTSSDNLIDLLSLNDYIKAGANNSYLNNENIFWTSTKSKDEIWYVFKEGGVNTTSINEYHNYGIRPVITIKNTTELISGEGSIDNPFVIENNTNNVLNQKRVGEYISYNKEMYRIIENIDNKVKVVMDDYLKVNDEYVLSNFDSKSNTYSLNTTIGKYLNNTFYNSLENKDYVIVGDFYTGSYSNYDYKNIYSTSINTNVGLLTISDMYINEYSDTLLMTPSTNTIYTISKDKVLYADKITSKLKIRPVIYLDGNLKTSGIGSKTEPYVLSR